MVWNQKWEGGTGIICVESNTTDVSPLLNILINSWVSCTCALIPLQFYIIAALLPLSSFKAWDGLLCSLGLFWKYEQHT